MYHSEGSEVRLPVREEDGGSHDESEPPLKVISLSRRRVYRRKGPFSCVVPAVLYLHGTLTRMALLYGLLWRLLLIFVHVNRALFFWLHVRIRSWKGRLWERAATVMLLPASLAGFPDLQTNLNHNPDANASPGSGKRADGHRPRCLSDGKTLKKLPVHIGLLVAEEEPSYTDIANLVVWCMAVGISYVSVYDNHGKHYTLMGRVCWLNCTFTQ